MRSQTYDHSRTSKKGGSNINVSSDSSTTEFSQMYDYEDDVRIDLLNSGKNGQILIMQLFAVCCKRLAQAINDSFFDFRIDIKKKTTKIWVRDKLEMIKITLFYAKDTVRRAREEFLMFQQWWSNARTESARRVAEALENMTQTHRRWDIQYTIAKQKFDRAQEKSLLQLYNPSTSDSHMDSIKAEAEKELRVLGQLTQDLQAAEAQLLMDFKGLEVTAIRSITYWRIRHASLVKSLKEKRSLLIGIMKIHAIEKLQKWARRCIILGKETARRIKEEAERVKQAEKLVELEKRNKIDREAAIE